VPVKAILPTSSIGFASTILAYLSPDTVILLLDTSSGAITLFEKLKVRMWAFRYLTYFAIAAVVAGAGAVALVGGRAGAADPELHRARRRARRPLVQAPVRTPLGSRAGRRHQPPSQISARRPPSHARRGRRTVIGRRRRPARSRASVEPLPPLGRR